MVYSDGVRGRAASALSYKRRVDTQKNVGRLFWASTDRPPVPSDRVNRVSDGCRTAKKGIGQLSDGCRSAFFLLWQPTDRVSYLSVGSDCIITADRQPTDRVSDGCRSFIWNILPLSDGCRTAQKDLKRVSDSKKWCWTAVGWLSVGCRSAVHWLSIGCRLVPTDSVGRLSDGFFGKSSDLVT